MYLFSADNLMLGRKLAEDAGLPDGGAAPADTTPAPAADATPAPSLQEFLTNRMAGTPDPTPADAPEGGTPKPDEAAKPAEPLVDIPDKFKAADGTVKVADLAKSYVNMESMHGKTVQQVNELQQTIITMQTQIAQQAQAANAEAPKGEQLSPEDLQAQIEADNDKFWAEYNDNPKAAIAKLVQDALQPEIAPLRYEAQKAQWDAQVNKARTDLPDFGEMLPTMRIIVEKGLVTSDDPNAVMTAYNLAKEFQAGNRPAAPAAAPKAPTVEELLKDQDFMAKIAQDPAVKNAVLSAHMQEVNNNGAPPVIGNKGLGAGSVPLNLTDSKTAKEALKEKYKDYKLT